VSAIAAAPAAVSKVTASHLARTAYLYVRQSTLRQVVSNTESGERQYALRQRAVALGWPAEQIVVIVNVHRIWQRAIIESGSTLVGCQSA